MLRRAAGGESAFYASRALQNTADIVKNWPAQIQSSQDVADIKGIGRGSQNLVGMSCWKPSWRLQLSSICIACQGCLQPLCSGLCSCSLLARFARCGLVRWLCGPSQVELSCFCIGCRSKCSSNTATLQLWIPSNMALCMPNRRLCSPSLPQQWTWSLPEFKSDMAFPAFCFNPPVPC